MHSLLSLFAPLLIAVASSGCTMDTAALKADAEATKAGCLCAGVQCAVIVSASGQAATGAEASGALRSLQTNNPKAK